MGREGEGRTTEASLTQARLRRLVTLAGHAGDEETARAEVSNEAASVRAAAISALARMDRLAPRDLANALADRDSAVRRRACELSIGLPETDLRQALEDPESLVVEAAAWAAGESQDRSIVNELARVATEHADPLCREAAVAALGAIGDDRGLPAILAAQSDRPAVRRRAVIALASYEGAAVDAALERARHDRDWQVRQAAEDLLGE
jgi:HEAT repeat protein